MKAACVPRMLYTPTLSQSHSHSFQHLPSHTSDSFTHSSSSVTGARSRDPQILLSQRWQYFSNEIAKRRLSRKSVIALDRSLDEVEKLLLVDAPEEVSHNAIQYGLDIAMRTSIEDARTLNVTTPPDSTRIDAPESVEPMKPMLEESQSHSSLLKRISVAIRQVQRRQQEFKHLHSVVIAKAEEDVERITQLESEVDRLQAEIVDDQAELTYLKLKIRILEIQALPYVPLKDKDGLTEGIQRWKLDWADVESRFRTRRKMKYPGKERDLETFSNVGNIYGTL